MKRKKAEINGKTWMLASEPRCLLVNAPKGTLGQASTEDQLRNFGMNSFVKAAAALNVRPRRALSSVAALRPVDTLVAQPN